MRDLDVEALRQAFSDSRVYLVFGLVRTAAVNSKASAVMVECEALGYSNPVTGSPWIIKARLGTDSAGPSSGDWDIPEAEDLVLLALPDGAPDQAVVVTRLSSNDEPVPTELTAAVKLVKGRPDQDILVKTTGAGNVTLATGTGKVRAGSAAAAEPMVLGNVLVTLLGTVIAQVEAIISGLETDPIVICGAPGAPGLIHPTLKTALDGVKSALDSAKSTYLDTAGTNIISQVAFTERSH